MKKRFIQSCRLNVNKFYKGLLTALICLISFSSLHATNYYVDNINGNNSNNGTSTGTAWFDFANVNSRTFTAGDQILLKAGCVWNSELYLKGSGTAGNFIVLDAYGTGNKPKIQRNSQVNDRTIFMTDVSYFKIRNLEVCNAGDGIRLNYTIKGQTSVYFENLYIHNIDIIVKQVPIASDNAYYSTGINISSIIAEKPINANDYVATDIRITNCELAFTTAPFTFIHFFENLAGGNNETPLSYSNVLVENNYIHDHKGPMSVRGLNNSVITNNVFKNGGTVYLSQGTTGIFNFNINNVIFEGNIMDGIPNTGSADQCWVDNEAYCDNVKFFGNVIKNTAGAGAEFLALGNDYGVQPPRGADDYNTNNIIDGNTFYNNGYVLNAGGSGVPAFPSGIVSNNNYQTGNIFFNGVSSGFTFINNIASTQTSTNLALYKSYIASSNWDDAQRASKAFDGSSSSNWQSAGGLGFAGQWLRINFGASTTFDKVVLSEYGDRTSGYRIEYSTDGISWQTAHTGTTIGNSNTINFTAVTGTMARIYFTNGANTPIIIEFEIYKATQSGGNNLASNKTYSSSTNWDGTQTADKGFDGSYSTNWQSSGTGFANQWLQVNFGAATTFDKVVLSEYGDRTSGFQIQYSDDGTNWQIAYTGTTIGTSKTISFTPVTGNYSRIYYTAGEYTPIIFEFEIYNTGLTPPFECNWTFAANENGTATFSGTKQIRYGANGVYNILTATNSIGCNNSVFGDPIPGVVKTCEVCNIDAGGGTGTNYVQNPSFDVDNFNTQTPTAWSTWTSAGTDDADYTETANQRTGARNLAHWRNGTYNVYTYQFLTAIPNGTYTATVYAKTIGTPSTCFLKAQGYGGADLITNISGSSYVKYTISNIQVTNGQCLIGVYTSGDQNSAAVFEDFTLSNNNNLFVNLAAPPKPSIKNVTTENSFNSALLYPNPAQGNVSVLYQVPPKSKTNISVYNVAGKLVKQVSFVSAAAASGKVDVDISGLSNGTYFLKVITNKHAVTHKLIIEK